MLVLGLDGELSGVKNALKYNINSKNKNNIPIKNEIKRIKMS